jgi:hypothetical protein
MDDWKIRQLLFKKFGVKSDFVSLPARLALLTLDEWKTGIDSQFLDSENTVHPYKSYCVALVYSLNLTEKYGHDPIYYLNEDMLPDDPCFQRYKDRSDIYDYYLSDLSWVDSPMAKKIAEYWYQEYCEKLPYEV